MKAEIREFVVASLKEMNYDVEGIDDDTTLGPSGVDLESLALADPKVRDAIGDAPVRRIVVKPPRVVNIVT